MGYPLLFFATHFKTTDMNNFKNPYFEDVFSTITSYMPLITFWGIIATYAITAALNVYFISLPPVISIPAAIAIQFGRFAIVFMDFLNPTGRKSSMPFFIAFAATIVAIFELYYSAGSFGLTEKEELSIILFGSSIIAMGFFLEVNFISKGAEAYGLGRGRPGRKANNGSPDTDDASTLDELLSIAAHNSNGNGTGE